jgi:hypothetical protein
MFPDTRKTITAVLCTLLAGCGGGGGGGESGSAEQPHSSLSTLTGEPASSARGDVTTPAAPNGDAAAGHTVNPASVEMPQADIEIMSPLITAPPASMNIPPYYQKYLDADGIAVLASAEVDDQALIRVKKIIDTMLAKRKDIRDALVAASSRFMIIPKDKGITTLPEYAYLRQVPAPAGYANWDERARGMGGLHTSCGEENLMKLSNDSYFGQSICIHEFAHTIQNSGIARAEPAFSSLLNDHYNVIRQEGFVANTYMATDVGEYWATAVQAWYNNGVCRPVADGVYGPLCDHLSLRQRDPGGYELVNRLFNPPF